MSNLLEMDEISHEASGTNRKTTTFSISGKPGTKNSNIQIRSYFNKFYTMTYQVKQWKVIHILYNMVTNFYIFT